MSRGARATLARSTLSILEEGRYRLPDGRSVEIAQDLKKCIEATRLLEPDALAARLARTLAEPPSASGCRLEIENQSTLAAIRSLVGEGAEPVAALNFASARNPGGGFLGGSQAQEESLARSSGLYPSLKAAPAFYLGLAPGQPRQRRSPGQARSHLKLEGLPGLQGVEPFQLSF